MLWQNDEKAKVKLNIHQRVISKKNRNSLHVFSLGQCMVRVHLDDWENDYRRKTGGRVASISYRLFGTRTARKPHYIGRSDSPITRIKAHKSHNGDCCEHHLVYVEYKIHKNTGRRRDRKNKSFRAECRDYHKFTLPCNLQHPDCRGVTRGTRCPVQGCNHTC